MGYEFYGRKANIYVESVYNGQKERQIQVTDFQAGANGICKLICYNKGIKIKEYLMNIRKMSYSNLSSEIILELENVSFDDKEYVAYSEI